MKKKYYTWEECMNLREVKVNFVLVISFLLNNDKWNKELVLIIFMLIFYNNCLLCSLCEWWSIRILWSWKRLLESMTFCILCLSTWYGCDVIILFSLFLPFKFSSSVGIMTSFFSPGTWSISTHEGPNKTFFWGWNPELVLSSISCSCIHASSRMFSSWSKTWYASVCSLFLLLSAICQ